MIATALIVVSTSTFANPLIPIIGGAAAVLIGSGCNSNKDKVNSSGTDQDKRIAELEAQVASLQSDLESCDNDILVERNKLETCETQLMESERDYVQLSNDYDDLYAECDSDISALESENSILLSQVSDLNNDISLLESELETLQGEVGDIFAVYMNVSIFCDGTSPLAVPAFIRNQVANNIRDRFILDFYQDHDVFFPWLSEDFDLDGFYSIYPNVVIKGNFIQLDDSDSTWWAHLEGLASDGNLDEFTYIVKSSREDLDSYIQSIEDYTQNVVVPLYASHGYLLSRDTCIDVTYESVGELLD